MLSQTWPDFELVAVDDGSSDATPLILRDYSDRDARIRILQSDSNVGQKRRLAELMAVARAPLIAISDQDDVWAPDKLQRLAERLGDAALAFGRSELIDAGGHSFGRSLLDVNRAERRDGHRLTILFRPQVSGHAMLARRGTITEAAFRSPHPYDWLISLVAQFSRGIVYDDGAIVYHRIHGANAHNSGVLTRMNLMRVGPRDIQKALEWVRSRRLRVVDGLEFLAASPLVPEAQRATLDGVAHLCRAAWLERKGPQGLKLRRIILDALRPLAGALGTYWQSPCPQR